MNKTVVGIIIAVLVVAGVVGIAMMKNKDDTSSADMSTASSQTSHADTTTDQQQSTSTDASQATAVTIENYAYSPKTVTVKDGSTVTWTNQDSVKHDVTPDTETDEFKASELLAKGESYSVTFTKAGTYTYYCSPHPYMKATVIVTE